MFRISAFSRFTRVTVKALRHDDRLGILTPAFVDPDSRYRFYSARQVQRLQRILALRELGFSLEHVADLLRDGSGGRPLRRLLEARRAELVRQIELDRERLLLLEATLREKGEGREPALPDVVLQSVAPLRVAARRARVPDLDAGVAELFEAVEADVARAGARAAGPPVLLYHDPDHRQTDADVEAAVPVKEGVRSAGRSSLRTLPGVARAACVAYAGSYDQWTFVLRRMLSWLSARRLAPAGPMREVYLQFAAGDAECYELPREHLVDSTEEFVTEMQIPVRHRPERSGSPP